MHSTVSDGTDTPADILADVKEAGIGLFSLTDHDAIKGCAMIQQLLTENDPQFVPGVELGCRDEDGQYHILGYGYDTDAEPMRNLVEKTHSIRMNKVRARLELLETKFGISFPEEEVRRLLARDNPGKPHIANLMVKYGYAETKDKAMKEVLNKLRVKLGIIRPEEAIAAILAGGGIPVLAHPTYGNGDQLILGEDMERRLRRLKEFGLLGVEAFYSGFTTRITGEMLDLKLDPVDSCVHSTLPVLRGKDFNVTVPDPETWEKEEGAEKAPNRLARSSPPYEEAEEAIRTVREFDFGTGRGDDGTIAFLVPEVAILRAPGGGYTAELLPGALPPLRIAKRYKDLANAPGTAPDARKYLAEKIRSGEFWMDAIARRNATVLAIAKEIARVQAPFFDHGLSRLKPMTLAEMGALVGLHETTVGRAIDNKSALTPQGTCPLRLCFTHAVRKPAATAAGSPPQTAIAPDGTRRQSFRFAFGNPGVSSPHGNISNHRCSHMDGGH